MVFFRQQSVFLFVLLHTFLHVAPDCVSVQLQASMQQNVEEFIKSESESEEKFQEFKSDSESEEELEEFDYVVVGAGMSGMGFVDELAHKHDLLEKKKAKGQKKLKILVVDSQTQPGGHQLEYVRQKLEMTFPEEHPHVSVEFRFGTSFVGREGRECTLEEKFDIHVYRKVMIRISSNGKLVHAESQASVKQKDYQELPVMIKEYAQFDNDKFSKAQKLFGEMKEDDEKRMQPTNTRLRQRSNDRAVSKEPIVMIKAYAQFDKFSKAEKLFGEMKESRRLE